MAAPHRTLSRLSLCFFSSPLFPPFGFFPLTFHRRSGAFPRRFFLFFHLLLIFSQARHLEVFFPPIASLSSPRTFFRLFPPNLDFLSFRTLAIFARHFFHSIFGLRTHESFNSFSLLAFSGRPLKTPIAPSPDPLCNLFKMSDGTLVDDWLLLYFLSGPPRALPLHVFLKLCFQSRSPPTSLDFCSGLFDVWLIHTRFSPPLYLFLVGPLAIPNSLFYHPLPFPPSRHFTPSSFSLSFQILMFFVELLRWAFSNGASSNPQGLLSLDSSLSYQTAVLVNLPPHGASLLLFFFLQA